MNIGIPKASGNSVMFFKILQNGFMLFGLYMAISILAPRLVHLDNTNGLSISEQEALADVNTFCYSPIGILRNPRICRQSLANYRALPDFTPVNAVSTYATATEKTTTKVVATTEDLK